jgi:hypothetical protein
MLLSTAQWIKFVGTEFVLLYSKPKVRLVAQEAHAHAGHVPRYLGALLSLQEGQTPWRVVWCSIQGVLRYVAHEENLYVGR